MWRELGNEVFSLIEPRCPCYCAGQGELILVACPGCGTVMGRCDEVEELIRNVRRPAFDPGRSLFDPAAPCPACGTVAYGQFRAATAEEVRALGFPEGTLRRWRG